jgi:uncharacterized membrane protein
MNRRGRSGAVRRRSRRSALAGWLLDRTVRRRWRRIQATEGMVMLVGAVVSTAFLVLVGMFNGWLAVAIGLVLLALLYRELGERAR